ncbi:hypothetical protein ES332_D08G092100v1, partial [Gossypium tomentosum]
MTDHFWDSLLQPQCRFGRLTVKSYVKMNRCPSPFEHLLKTLRRVEKLISTKPNKPETITEKAKLLIISLSKYSR